MIALLGNERAGEAHKGKPAFLVKPASGNCLRQLEFAQLTAGTTLASLTRTKVIVQLSKHESADVTLVVDFRVQHRYAIRDGLWRSFGQPNRPRMGPLFYNKVTSAHAQHHCVLLSIPRNAASLTRSVVTKLNRCELRQGSWLLRNMAFQISNLCTAP